MDTGRGDESASFMDSVYKRVKNRIHMKKAAKDFLNGSEYAAAREILQSLLELQEESEAQLATLLQIAECDIMINRKVSPKTDSEILRTLDSSGKTSYDVREMAGQRDNAEAVIAFSYACKLLKEETDANQAVKDSENCIMRASQIVKEMAKKPDLTPSAIKISHLMVEMVKEMNQIERADANLRVLTQATCIARIGYVMNKTSRIHEAFDLLKEGRAIMVSHFGPSAPKYRVYAATAHNMAALLVRRGKFVEAASFHENAIAEMEVAEDITEAERRRQLDDFKSGLESERDIASWLQSRGLQDDAVVEMACAAAHKRTKKQKGTKATGREEYEWGNDIPGADLPQNLKNWDSGHVEVDIPIETAAREVLSGGVIGQSTNQSILSAFESKGSSWKEIREMSEKTSGAEAVILHLYTCKLLPFAEPPDTVVREVAECFKRSRNTIEQMVKGGDRSHAQNLLYVLCNILQELKGITNCTAELKVLVEANCLNKLGSIYIQLSKYSIAVKQLLEGRSLMLGYFGPNAPRHSVYASMANNIGYAYGKQGDYVNSVEYYVKAFDDMQRAEVGTATMKKEKLTTYKKAFETALSFADRNNPERANILRQQFASHEIMQDMKREADFKIKDPNLTPKPSMTFHAEGNSSGLSDSNSSRVASQKTPSAESPLKKGTKTNSTYPLVGVGNSIYVDHTKPLREGYQVFPGKLGDENVAVKKIDFSDEHMREVDIMQKIEKHPNTVEYKAWTAWESSEMPGIKAIYIAMELCQNETLYELAKKESFTMRDRISSLLQFTRGLCHIHHNDIIHGDLKPHNLLRSIGEGLVKVADFGISKRLDRGKTHITLSSKQIGTCGWMAPDVTLTKKYDIFSAGLIYSYVLSGVEDFPAQGAELGNLAHTDAIVARELISRMTDLDRTKRPSVEECCESPLFWDDKRKIQFISSLSDHLSPMPDYAEVMQQMAKRAHEVLGENWAEKLAFMNDAESSIQAKVVYDRAIPNVNFRPDCINSLMQFMADCCRVEADVQLQPIFPTEVDVWRFFNPRFPKLLLAVYKVAKKCGFLWSTEEKFQYLHQICSHVNTELETCAKNIFHGSWLENLILDKATVEKIQQKVTDDGYQYKISKYSVYNKAVSKDRDEEVDYDEKSLCSLLTFINNRRKYFKEDGKMAEWIFGDDTTGIWGFFLSRFPNLLDDVVLFLEQ